MNGPTSAPLPGVLARRKICGPCPWGGTTAAARCTHPTSPLARSGRPILIAKLTLLASSHCPANLWQPLRPIPAEPSPALADARQKICLDCPLFNPIQETCARCSHTPHCIRRRQRDPFLHCPLSLW